MSGKTVFKKTCPIPVNQDELTRTKSFLKSIYSKQSTRCRFFCGQTDSSEDFSSLSFSSCASARCQTKARKRNYFQILGTHFCWSSFASDKVHIKTTPKLGRPIIMGAYLPQRRLTVLISIFE